MIEIPSCSYAVALNTVDFSDAMKDKTALLEWFAENVTGAYFIIASTGPITLAAPPLRWGKTYGRIADHTGAIFVFEWHDEALHFQMRYQNGS